MAEDTDAPNRGSNAWGQVIMALALVGALGVGLWTLTEPSNAEVDSKPARCSGGEFKKPTDGSPDEGGPAARRVSGAQLCAALNRPDLAALLGTAGEVAKSANGNGSATGPKGGEKVADPSARVQFDTYTVELSASYDRLPVARTAVLLGESAQRRTVLNRPAILYSDRTINIRFRLDGSDASTGPGFPARALAVAKDAKDSGGALTLTVWREDGIVPNDDALLRVARAVLPTVPRWAATD